MTVTVAVLAGCGSGSRSTVYLPSTCTDQRIKPAMFVPSACATAQLGVDKLTWKDWGGPITQGSGFAYRNDCTPDCVSGGVHYAPAEVYASVPKNCPNGRRQYTHVTIAVTPDPAGVASALAGTYAVPCAYTTAAAMGSVRIDSGP